MLCCPLLVAISRLPVSWLVELSVQGNMEPSKCRDIVDVKHGAQWVTKRVGRGCHDWMAGRLTAGEHGHLIQNRGCPAGPVHGTHAPPCSEPYLLHCGPAPGRHPPASHVDHKLDAHYSTNWGAHWSTDQHAPAHAHQGRWAAHTEYELHLL